MSLRRLWGVLAIALPVLAALLAPMSTVDLAYQLRAGADILATGSIPTVDAYTATVAGQAWWDQQWAAQAVLAAVNGAAGWTGLVVLRAGLTGLAFAAVLLAAQARGAGARAAAVLAIIAFLLASPALALRPQLFGVALFAGTLWALGERRRRPRVAWLVPLLAVAWANAHGSFVLAPLAAGWAWLEDVVDREPRGRRTFALAATTLAATAVTPWGPWVWGYAAGLSTNAALAARVTEWQPPSPTDPVGAAFLVSGVVVALVVAVRWRAGRRASWAALAWIAGLFLLGLRAIRGLAWWPIGAVAALAPLFAERAAAVEPPTPPGIRRLNLALVGILVVAGVALLPAWRPADDVAGPDGVLRDAPAGIVRALRAVAPEGSRLFHPQRWGSWLEYATPGLRTFVDSRIELFPDAVWADYEAVATGAAGWEAVLTARGIDFVVGSPDDVDLERRLTAAGWTRTYAGADGWVFAVPPVAGNG